MDDKALISRRVLDIDRGRVVVDERWNSDHPAFPFRDNLQYVGMGSRNPYVRQIEMTREEFDERYPGHRSRFPAGR